MTATKTITKHCEAHILGSNSSFSLWPGDLLIIKNAYGAKGVEGVAPCGLHVWVKADCLA